MRNLTQQLFAACVLAGATLMAQNAAPVDPGPRPEKKLEILGPAVAVKANIYIIGPITTQDPLPEKDGFAYYFPRKGSEVDLGFRDGADRTSPFQTSYTFYAITCSVATFLAGKAEVGKNAWPLWGNHIADPVIRLTPLRIPETKFTIVAFAPGHSFGYLPVDAAKYRLPEGGYKRIEDLAVPIFSQLSDTEQFWRGKKVRIEFGENETIKGYDLYKGEEVPADTSVRPDCDTLAPLIDRFVEVRSGNDRELSPPELSKPCADLVFTLKKPLAGQAKLVISTETSTDGLYFVSPEKIAHSPLLAGDSLFGPNFPKAPMSGYACNITKNLADDPKATGSEAFGADKHLFFLRVRSKHYAQTLMNPTMIHGQPPYYGVIPKDIKFSTLPNGRYAVEFEYNINPRNSRDVYPGMGPKYNLFRALTALKTAAGNRTEAKAAIAKIRDEQAAFEARLKATRKEFPYPYYKSDSDLLPRYHVTAPLSDAEKAQIDKANP